MVYLITLDLFSIIFKPFRYLRVENSVFLYQILVVFQPQRTQTHKNIEEESTAINFGLKWCTEILPVKECCVFHTGSITLLDAGVINAKRALIAIIVQYFKQLLLLLLFFFILPASRSWNSAKLLV